ncbi:hypothetical protein J8273_5208 [Carpediemonas membranifera]|uniref:Uncharacterized protein n=1 Tax=Carpediemonas membranifera TaxID=201153 RepID=A0A8J6ATS8_9EUKA|nr:hypothetical protein J8273_5208 [Carpediemonas membranifera]|eukprot:KAG9392225.1 hypothetical protein J8273_5208 [Carpediemonas membranifera]
MERYSAFAASMSSCLLEFVNKHVEKFSDGSFEAPLTRMTIAGVVTLGVFVAIVLFNFCSAALARIVGMRFSFTASTSRAIFFICCLLIPLIAFPAMELLEAFKASPEEGMAFSETMRERADVILVHTLLTGALIAFVMLTPPTRPYTFFLLFVPALSAATVCFVPKFAVFTAYALPIDAFALGMISLVSMLSFFPTCSSCKVEKESEATEEPAVPEPAAPVTPKSPQRKRSSRMPVAYPDSPAMNTRSRTKAKAAQ